MRRDRYSSFLRFGAIQPPNTRVGIWLVQDESLVEMAAVVAVS